MIKSITAATLAGALAFVALPAVAQNAGPEPMKGAQPMDNAGSGGMEKGGSMEKGSMMKKSSKHMKKHSKKSM